MTSLLLSFALAASILHPAHVRAEGEAGRRVCLNPAETREALASRKLREPMNLLRDAARQAKAEPLVTRLCRWGDRLVYEMSLLRRDGRVLRVYVDAASGDSLSARDR
ncbi:MAG: hypothetical protein JWL93_2730 [Hyphomicrobiales bacterium]|nr:hypothetical protein [Hyphomicrobiales bacterium]